MAVMCQSRFDNTLAIFSMKITGCIFETDNNSCYQLNNTLHPENDAIQKLKNKKPELLVKRTDSLFH